MAVLALRQAATIVDTALATARRSNFAPLTVAVLDAGGHLVALKREDRSSLLRPEIAIGKAWSVLGMGFGGRELERRAKAAPGFYAAIAQLASGNMVPVPGGVLIRDEAGAIIGSVGITGDTSANDEICAIAGIEAAGLVPDTGDPQ